ncbi:hypothetical protein PIB30_004989 [Stylosanthes scabra]|uniref:PB1-like domain-containing protein n=1 Tax=Stylosanthes scabra TaxID=79078 RepID=A0ABU6X1T2_9FABA|nr:hypothetical protein [Stylosanthes scabra]
MAESKHISLIIHHRGKFEHDSNGVFAYVDGETGIVDWHGMDPAHGLKVFKYDKDVITMYEAAENNGDEIEVFTKHPISVPVVADECGPDAGVTNDSPPVTPSKGRKNVRARRTPTPKRARGPKRSILVSEGSNREEEGQEDVCAQLAKTIGEVNQEPPIYPRRDPNLFSQPPQTPTQQPKPTEINQTQQGSAESVVPLTNQAPFTSSKVHTARSESTQPQSLHNKSSRSTQMPNSSEVPSNKLLTQYVPIPQVGPMSQSLIESPPTPPSVTVNNPTNNEENAQGSKKKRKNISTKRPPPTGQRFMPNADPCKPSSVYISVNQEDYSDEDAGYHCYESEELNSIASDMIINPMCFHKGIQMHLQERFD